MNIFPVHVCLLIGNMSAAEDGPSPKPCVKDCKCE